MAMHSLADVARVHRHTSNMARFPTAWIAPRCPHATLVEIADDRVKRLSRGDPRNRLLDNQCLILMRDLCNECAGCGVVLPAVAVQKLPVRTTLLGVSADSAQ